jgi:hypothetical protein
MLKQSLEFRTGLLTAAAAAALLSLPAQATVVLDTFGPGDTATGSLWNLYFTGAQWQELAVSFSLSEAAIVTEILTSIEGFGSFGLGIAPEPGLSSGPFLHGALLVDPVANSGLTGLSWSLAAGDYWLVARAQDEFSRGNWAGGQQADGPAWAPATSSVGPLPALSARPPPASPSAPFPNLAPGR